MNLELIEEKVDSANRHESETGTMLEKLASEIPNLPGVISLPDQDPAIALRDFIVEYINHAPSFIAAVSFAAKDAGIEEYVSPFLDVATNYFLEPVPESGVSGGLEELMHQAYLAHRLIEEVNDQYIVRAGIPLIPMEMTKANIIVHQLIGETLAVSLDEVVEQTASQMTARDSVYGSEQFKAYVETRKGPGWDQVWKQWTDMTNTLAIDLDFDKAR